MYKVSKTLQISSSHVLDLPYDSPCSCIHGHNWIITVCVASTTLNKAGMVIDFMVIKEVVMAYDHRHINSVSNKQTKRMGQNPTAENMARWIAEDLDVILSKPDSNLHAVVHEVTVQESEGNVACYIP